LQIDFDSTVERTTLLPPWLDPKQRRLYKKVFEMGEYVAQRVREYWPEEPVCQAATAFVNRGGQLALSAFGLLKLYRIWEAPLLIRVLFEHATQFEYLMQKPSERAQQYLDFAHIAKYMQMRAIVENPTGPISTYVAASPLRPESEKRNKGEYDRVRGKFQNRRGKTWDSWYGMTVRDLAEAVGREGEYKYWYKMGSAHAHGDPFAAARGATFQSMGGAILFAAGCVYYCRILQPSTSSMVLPAEYDEVFKAVGRDFS